MRRLSRSAVRRGNSVLPPLRIPSVSSRRQLSIDGSDNNNTRNNGPFTSFTDEGNATEFSRNVRRLNRATSVPPPNSRIAQEYEPFLTVNPFANEAETISMYTDASCKQGFGCGIGVFFGDRPPLSELNISERLVNVEQNSGLAEIKAARAGLDKLHRWPHYASQNVTVYSDYLPMIHSLQFPKPFGRFTDEVLDLRKEARAFPLGVLFQHVTAHSNIHGNEQADTLARKALGLGRSKSRSKSRSRSVNRVPNGDENRSPSPESRPRTVYIPGLKSMKQNRINDNEVLTTQSKRNAEEDDHYRTNTTQSSDSLVLGRYGARPMTRRRDLFKRGNSPNCSQA